VTAVAHELDYEATILTTAKMAGWRRHGERAAQSKKGWRTPIKGEAGWPDLFLVRGPEAIAAELKVIRAGNLPTSDQIEWLECLAAVPGITALVLWLPRELDLFNTALFKRPFVWRDWKMTLRDSA